MPMKEVKLQMIAPLALLDRIVLEQAQLLPQALAKEDTIAQLVVLLKHRMKYSLVITLQLALLFQYPALLGRTQVVLVRLLALAVRKVNTVLILKWMLLLNVQ